MSFVVATVRIEDFGAGTLGVKEALAMRLEPLGGVRVVDVQTMGGEQMQIPGTDRRQAPPPHPGPAPAPAAGGQSRVRARPRAGTAMECCLSCAHFQMKQGWDADEKLRWGDCVHTGKPLHEINKRCDAWAAKFNC
jgi:hypothetical protein